MFQVRMKCDIVWFRRRSWVIRIDQMPSQYQNRFYNYFLQFPLIESKEIQSVLIFWMSRIFVRSSYADRVDFLDPVRSSYFFKRKLVGSFMQTGGWEISVHSYHHRLPWVWSSIWSIEVGRPLSCRRTRLTFPITSPARTLCPTCTFGIISP